MTRGSYATKIDDIKELTPKEKAELSRVVDQYYFYANFHDSLNSKICWDIILVTRPALTAPQIQGAQKDPGLPVVQVGAQVTGE